MHPAVEALRQFANRANWQEDKWVGQRNPVEYAIDVLASLEVVCTMCHTTPPFGGVCPHPGCFYRLDQKLKLKQPLRF